jgi:hypothetical protein
MPQCTPADAGLSRDRNSLGCVEHVDHCVAEVGRKQLQVLRRVGATIAVCGMAVDLVRQATNPAEIDEEGGTADSSGLIAAHADGFGVRRIPARLVIRRPTRSADLLVFTVELCPRRGRIKLSRSRGIAGDMPVLLMGGTASSLSRLARGERSAPNRAPFLPTIIEAVGCSRPT